MANTTYLTYTEYQSYGGTLTSLDFASLEFRARKRIDYLTDSRVRDMAEVPESVKRCVFALIDIDSAAGIQGQIHNPTVTSFNTDGYSESYGKAVGAADAEAGMRDLIGTYLYGETDDYGTPLLYRGVTRW